MAKRIVECRIKSQPGAAETFCFIFEEGHQRLAMALAAYGCRCHQVIDIEKLAVDQVFLQAIAGHSNDLVRLPNGNDAIAGIALPPPPRDKIVGGTLAARAMVRCICKQKAQPLICEARNFTNSRRPLSRSPLALPESAIMAL